MVKLKRLNFLFLFILLSVYSCKKTDLINQPTEVLKEESVSLTKKFFSAPPNIDPIIEKIIAEISQRNSRKEFISAFASSKGFAIWDKPQINISSLNRNGGNFAGQSPDTLVYIPLVLQNTSKVNGFIRAVLNDSKA